MSNALGSESSPYLQSAAHQPVAWMPWGDAAFARARTEDKPILLDIGAVWCHWCHVMDHESYEDAAVADVLNRDFVCIKVDRDERPDVDARYQRAVQALTGQGGWPLTAFLTADGEAFFGGTYFPPDENHYGRPGFTAVLRHVAQLYRAERDKVAGNARALRQHLDESLDEAKPGAVDASLVAGAADQMARAFDIRYGGFGTAPKFPHPAACEFLLARWYDTKADWPREIVEKTLTAMARGGVRDHVGGGFHRYATDERWIVPHFEKMSYDNAALLHAYLAGFEAFGVPLYREVASGIVDWVLEVLCDRERGAFYSSQDADTTPGDDGDYWKWTREELNAVLTGAELDAVLAAFDVEHDNVLWLAHPTTDDRQLTTIHSALHKLKAARDRRRAPVVDRTAYVNWNAMMAGAFLRAGATLDRAECNAIALKVLERIATEGWDRRGLLDDAVQAAAAFLDAFEATGITHWLDRASAVMRSLERTHWDDTKGGYFDAARDGARPGYLAAAAKPVQDGPTPSANGVAALVLARLWAITDDKRWREPLDRQLRAFAGAARELSLYGATFARAVDWALSPVTRIEVSGPAGPGPACAMHLLALQTYRPRRIVIRKVAVSPAATVCVGTTCSLPVAAPARLAELLR